MIPTVTIRATYDCTYWPNVCPSCGAEVEAVTDGRRFFELAGRYGPFHDGGGYVCSACGPLTGDPSPAEYPAQWGGWCDPANPWGTADDDRPTDDGFDHGEPIVLTLPIYTAAEFLAAFPGAIWDTDVECEPSQNYGTGVYTTVTAHVDGPGATAALVLAAEMMGVQR